MKNQRYLLQHVIFTYVCTTEQHMAKLFKRGKKKMYIDTKWKTDKEKICSNNHCKSTVL